MEEEEEMTLETILSISAAYQVGTKLEEDSPICQILFTCDDQTGKVMSVFHPLIGLYHIEIRLECRCLQKYFLI